MQLGKHSNKQQHRQNEMKMHQAKMEISKAMGSLCTLAKRWLKHRAAKKFCREWAGLHSKEYAFDVRHVSAWDKPWRVEFYDLHRWDGKKCHWNCHDVGSGEGMSSYDAWEDMASKIIGYENASSREEALMKAELAMARGLPRGWGCDEYSKYYELLHMEG